MNLPDWLKIFELKPRFLFAIWVIGALFLYLPVQTKDTIGITEFITTYRTFIGIATIVAFVLWIIQLEPWEIIFDLLNEKRFNKEFSAKIDDLSDEERILLAYCIARKKQTIHLTVNHSVATSLRAKGFLNYIDGIFNSHSTPFTIPSFVWKELQNHKNELLEKDDWENPKVNEIFQELDLQMAENERETFR
jgi:hypothetical protein